MNPQQTANFSAIQGSSPQLQGSSPRLQQTFNPQQAGQGIRLNVGATPVQSFGNQQVAQATAFNTNAQNQYNSLAAQIAALERQIANKPIAPTLDYNAIQASARAAAEKNVTPLYQQKLNEYLQNEAAAKAEQQQFNQLAVQSAQSALQNIQAQNQITQQGTAQKQQLTLGSLNQQEQSYQQNQGTAFDAKRAALAESIGSGGLTASGIGQQKLYMAENQRNTEEAQQTGQFQYNRDIANLEANNTFAQLTQSGAYAQTQFGQSKQKADLNLSSYLRQAAYDEETFRMTNEFDRQNAIYQQTQQGAAQQVANFVSSFRNNPGVYNAALQAYGGLMR